MHLDFEIDKLSCSIEDAQTGVSYETEVLPLLKSDMEQILKKNGWQFDWMLEIESPAKSVFKLVIMAIIREPKDIDFVVEPHVLTDEDKRIVAEHIRTHKAKLR